MSRIRFATWAAVSRGEQATPDKPSLEDQEGIGRAAGLAKGWEETAGPYIVPGASRSFYVNLSDAEQDIPELRRMLEDARNNAFDVLIIKSYDRLGDLVDMVAQSLRFYGKQLYSVTQPVDPQDPEHFDPYAAESEAIMRDAARITQRFRINDLRRKYKTGMPQRVRNGLNPLRPPFAYSWVGKKLPPQLDPLRGTLTIQMKEMLMNGTALSDIARHADKSGIPPPNGGNSWDDSTIKYILSNPFYAGLVSIWRTASVPDPRRKRKRRPIQQPRSKWVVGEGKHERLWDEATHYAILRELERRHEMHKHYAVRYPFSGLLTCAVCHQKLHRHGYSTGSKRRRVLTCAEGEWHVFLFYDEGVDLIARELANYFRDYEKHHHDSAGDHTKIDNAALEQIAEERKRIQEGYKRGIYRESEAAEEISKLEKQSEMIELRKDQRRRQAEVQSEFTGRIQQNLHRFPEFIKNDDPAVINQLLSAVFETIMITPDKKVEPVPRGD